MVIHHLYNKVQFVPSSSGFLEILAMLTSVGSVSEEQFQLQFEMMRKCPNTYFVTVIEDKRTGKVIGCATLLLEYKFIHSAGTSICSRFCSPLYVM